MLQRPSCPAVLPRSCCLTSRSTGPATARHPGREAAKAHHLPRGQGASPPRSGYLCVRRCPALSSTFALQPPARCTHAASPSLALWQTLLRQRQAAGTGKRRGARSSNHRGHLRHCSAVACRARAPATAFPGTLVGSASATPTDCSRRAFVGGAAPNSTFNRSSNGMAPGPRDRLGSSSAARARRHAVAARLTPR